MKNLFYTKDTTLINEYMNLFLITFNEKSEET